MNQCSICEKDYSIFFDQSTLRIDFTKCVKSSDHSANCLMFDGRQCINCYPDFVLSSDGKCVELEESKYENCLEFGNKKYGFLNEIEKMKTQEVLTQFSGFFNLCLYFPLVINFQYKT